ncbi:MAG: helix-turn-helix domain-containing protein [Bacteroidota bacterium]
MSIDKKSIAVLPFDNLSSDPENEYFSDGMTEEIINALSKIKGLMVTARTSTFAFKHQKLDVRMIGKRLRVSLVLEGSVRRSGDKVRITAQLIRTDNGFHIWSENFDRQMTDIFELQDDVSIQIAHKIREHFGHLNIQDQLVQRPTGNVEAYDLYLRGRYHHNQWDMSGFAKATEYYRSSIEADPRFDLPYFAAGLSYSFLGSWGGMGREEAFQLADAYFDQGRDLGDVGAFGSFCLGKHLFWGLWQYREAHSLLLRVLDQQPSDANANEFMAEILTALGDFRTAHHYIDRALKASPLAPYHYYTKGNIYYLQGEYPEAVACFDKGLEVAPGFTALVELKLACLIQMGDVDALNRTVAERELAVPGIYSLLLKLVHEPGSAADVTLQTVRDEVRRHPAILFGWDLVLSTYQDPQTALDLLVHKAQGKVGQAINFKHDPFLAPIRSLPGYKKLVNTYFPDSTIAPPQSFEIVSKAPLTDKESSDFEQLLRSRMDQHQDFLKPNLGLRDLAATIDLHPNKLSWLLNEKLGQNFYEFVNGYRLREFQRKAKDPSKGHLSLLGIALESGFNSKSVFNEYFKKSTGLTPKAWLTQQD